MLEEWKLYPFEYRNWKNSFSNVFLESVLKFLSIDKLSFSSGKFGLNDKLLHSQHVYQNFTNIGNFDAVSDI